MVKYEVVVELTTGIIVWVFGSLPGSFHDVTMFRIGGISTFLAPNEKTLADKAYIGERQYCICPIKGKWENLSESEKRYNKIHGAGRVIAENAYCRLKIFGFTQQKWRQSIGLHEIAFKTICMILNVEFVFHPARSTN